MSVSTKAPKPSMVYAGLPLVGGTTTRSGLLTLSDLSPPFGVAKLLPPCTKDFPSAPIISTSAP